MCMSWLLHQRDAMKKNAIRSLTSCWVDPCQTTVRWCRHEPWEFPAEMHGFGKRSPGTEVVLLTTWHRSWETWRATRRLVAIWVSSTCHGNYWPIQRRKFNPARDSTRVRSDGQNSISITVMVIQKWNPTVRRHTNKNSCLQKLPSEGQVPSQPRTKTIDFFGWWFD